MKTKKKKTQVKNRQVSTAHFQDSSQTNSEENLPVLPPPSINNLETEIEISNEPGIYENQTQDLGDNQIMQALREYEILENSLNEYVQENHNQNIVNTENNGPSNVQENNQIISDQNRAEQNYITDQQIRIDYSFPEKEEVALQKQYLSNIRELLTHLMSLKIANQNTVLKEIFLSLTQDQKDTFKKIIDTVHLAIGKKIRINELNQICHEELEFFKDNLNKNTLSQAEQDKLLNLLQEIQCTVYKDIFATKMNIDLYAPKKIHKESINFLDKLLNAIEIDQSTQPCLNSVKKLKEVFAEKINVNILLFIQNQILLKFDKDFLDTILKSCKISQNTVIENNNSKPSLFIRFHTIQSYYYQTYYNQYQYLIKSKKNVDESTKWGHALFEVVLSVKNNLDNQIKAKVPKKGKEFLQIEYNNLKTQLEKNKDITQELKNVYLERFKPEATVAYKAIKINKLKEKQTLYLKNTISNLQQAQLIGLKWNRTLNTIKNTLLQNFYISNEDQVRDILNTEFIECEKSIKESNELKNFDLSSQLYEHQKSIVKTEKLNIQTPDMHKMFEEGKKFGEDLRNRLQNSKIF